MDYPPTKTPPWAHQVECWNLAKNHKYFYIPHDVGAGKSKEAVDYANGVDAKSIIILCPQKVIPHWPKEFNKHSALNYQALALKKSYRPVSYKASQVKKFIKSCSKTSIPYIVVINYEAFWRPPMGPIHKKNRIIDLGELMSYKWDLVIADEAHRTKAPNSEQSWGLMRLASRCNRRLFLSGTPMPNSPLDVYAQYRALDSSIFGRSFARFRARYAIMGGYENRQVIKYINQKELNEKFFSIAAPYIKIDDVLEMPETQDIELPCELDESTMRLYRELEREFIAEYGTGEVTVSNALEKLLRLAQITAGILVLDDESVQTIDNNKIDTVIDKISDIPKEEPVVIFYRFKPEVARIKPELKKLGRVPCEISGSIDEQEKFENGKADTAVVQIRAGGEGVDILKRAHYCFYLSMTYSLGEYRQSKGRIWRPGQTEKCIFYHVIAKGTTDPKILTAIKRKKKIVEHVLEELSDRTIIQLSKTGTNNG